MTLILSMISDDFVIQVSDRRLSAPLVGGGSRIVEDSNKAIVYCNRAVIAFQGLAHLDGQPSDQWVAARLSEYTRDSDDLASGLRSIAADLTSLFTEPPQHGREFALCVNGYAMKTDGSAAAFDAIVTNRAHDDDGWLPDPVPHFQALFRPAKPRTFVLTEFPGFLTPSDLQQMAEDMKDKDPVKTLVKKAWEIASREASVGDQLMVCLIPRPPTGLVKEVSLTEGGPELPTEGPAFYHISPSQQARTFGPAFVCGRSSLGGIAIDRA